MTKIQSTTIRTRSCDGCTVCCEGWHTSNINGHEMFPGRPCHFFSNKCTIYEFRPDNPCRAYACAWLEDDKNVFPEWFKPDISGVLCDWRDWEDGKYLEVREAGKKTSTEILLWLYEFSARHNLRMRIQINGQWHSHGDQRFVTAFD